MNVFLLVFMFAALLSIFAIRAYRICRWRFVTKPRTAYELLCDVNRLAKDEAQWPEVTGVLRLEGYAMPDPLGQMLRKAFPNDPKAALKVMEEACAEALGGDRDALANEAMWIVQRRLASEADD